MEGLVEPFAQPRWIEAGPGCLDAAGRYARLLGGGKVLVGVGGVSAQKSGLLARLENVLQREQIPYEIWEGIPAEPTLEVADRGAERVRVRGCQTLIALGGGSVIDTVKLAAILANHEGHLAEDFQLGRAQFSRPSRPVIAIPTTAGTGSEATKVSVMTNPRLGVKKSIYNWDMVATVVLLDAHATQGLPPEITRDTGLDALGQAIEGYLSTRGNVFTAAAASMAVLLIHRALPSAVRDGEDLQARHEMLLAAFQGGVAMGTGVGLGHELAMAVGSFKKISHGSLVGILTPYALAANLGYADRKIAELAFHFGVHGNGDEAALARAMVRRTREFDHQLGLPGSLGELGVTSGDIDRILELSKKATDIRTNPRPLDDQLRRAVLERAIAGSDPLG